MQASCRGTLLAVRIPMRPSLLAGISLPFVLAGCLSAAPPLPPVSPAPAMRPEAFFAGRTEGRGELTLRGGSTRPLKVESRGQVEPDGSFRLDQTITFDDGERETRTWHMRSTGPQTYTGTLSDASGTMTGEVDGNRFHLRYRVRSPAVYMEQWLYLEPDGQSAVNIGEITVLGIPWGRLDERIVRVR